MAFVRKKNKHFKWPVVVREPSETNAGEYAENEFIAIFARLTRTEYAKLGETNDELESLKKILKGWEQLEEEDGTPVKYSTNNLKALLEDPFWTTAVLDSYGKALEESKLKN